MPFKVCPGAGLVITTVGAEVSVDGTRRMEVDREDPFKAAATVADWFDEILPAFAVNVAVVAPLFTATTVGTVRRAVLDVTLTEAPPVGAAADNDTVHVALPELDTEAALQVRAVNVTAEVPCTVPCVISIALIF